MQAYRSERTTYIIAPEKSSKNGISNNFIIRQHTVSDAKLVDDVALFTGCHAHFLADILHVDLQFLDAAIARIPSDRPNDGGI